MVLSAALFPSRPRRFSSPVRRAPNANCGSTSTRRRRCRRSHSPLRLHLPHNLDWHVPHTLGFGLLITMGSTTTIPSLIAIEIVAAMGVGTVFQAPLIAYQTALDPADMAKATALFGFVRSLSTSISIVVGGVVFQNTFASHGHELSTALGNAL